MKFISKIKDKHLQDIVKGGSINFLFYALNIVVVYLLSIFISKIYGPEVYGRFAIIKSLILILIIFSTLGLNTLAIKLSSNEKYFNDGTFKSDFLVKSYAIIIITTVLISILILFNRQLFASNVFKDNLLEDYFYLFPIILISAVLLNYNSNLFKGQGRVILFSVISSFLPNIILLTALYLIYKFSNQGEFYIVLCLALSYLFVLILSFFYVFPLKWDNVVTKVKAKSLLLRSYPMMISASMIYLIFSVDTIMLGMLETSENVGIYRIVSQVSSVISVFIIVLGTVVGPKISKLYANNEISEFKKLIQNSSKILFYISFPLLILILIFAYQILGFFGTSYQKGHTSLIILSVCQFLFVVTGFVDIILNMTGHQKIFGKITIFTAALNITLNLIFIPKYGINGAAMATGFSIVLNNLIGLFYIKKKLNVITLYLPLQKSKSP
ncbi:flippase [Aureibaculum sp. 2210JD6-5]|uniref:flippase n=1 Tax=Aureibaculum sp. 2210JD6-5 TaxID=3103957 RepID=UPI002AAE16E0|nr:flippase [Aureibaculum sp. 2210JD6-5]MDY7396191.1 flippase [Aureibaculum sp. 2210JD6-5]